MNVAVEALDVQVADSDMDVVNREVTQRFTSSMFAGVRDLRLRIRRVKDALLCVAVVGFAGGDLVTSTASSGTPLEAIVGALDGLPDRIHRSENARSNASPSTTHAAVRAELKRLLREA